MKNKLIIICSFIICAIVLVSGCTSNTEETDQSESLDNNTEDTNTSSNEEKTEVEAASWDACPKCGANDGESISNSADGTKSYCRCYECGYEYWATIPEELR